MMNCTTHGTKMIQEWTEAEPHPEGGIVPAHWQSFCDDCLTEELAAEEANLCEQTECNLHNPEEPAEDLPKWTVYAEGEIGSRHVSTKSRPMGYAVNVLDHHILADRYGSLPIVREDQIEELAISPNEIEDDFSFGFAASDWDEIDTLRNKEISKEAGLKFD